VKKKTFDCVEMKWDIQRKLREEFAGISEAEKRRILVDRIKSDAILGPFIKRVNQAQTPTPRQ